MASEVTTTDDARGLAAGLLHAPIAGDVPGARRWAYPPWGIALVSVFVLYHTLTLLLHATPNGGFARELFGALDAALEVNGYMRATSNTQSWSMFAPNPHRANIYIQVFVEDDEGALWDLAHDSYGRRSWPYVFYDRMDKINRRLGEQEHYLQPYGAWVCRAWERAHEGRPARRVKFVKAWSDVPPPAKVYEAPESIRYPWSTMGFDPMRLPQEKRELRTVDCRTSRQAQLSPALRERFGLPPAPPGHYRPLDLKTWWDNAEAEARAEEVRARQAAAQEAGAEGVP